MTTTSRRALALVLVQVAAERDVVLVIRSGDHEGA
jgi:hypothetical protein